jgi:hypothetical protein
VTWLTGAIQAGCHGRRHETPAGRESRLARRLASDSTLGLGFRIALQSHQFVEGFFFEISTNNIARGMIRARHKYAFNPLKIRFHPNIKLPTNATNKLEKWFALIFLSPGPTPVKPSRSSVDFFFIAP